MKATSPRLGEPCRHPAQGTRPARKRFSLTRARPSDERLSRGDRMRAAVFSAAAQCAVWVIEKTLRHRSVGEAVMASYRRLGPGSLLFAMWHGEYFPIFSYARDSGVCVFVSRSPDGEILARLLTRHGYRVVRGSNTRGATRAVIDLARAVDEGRDAAIAVDGPRGPVDEAKPGIVLLAKVTGCPIVPLGAGMSCCKRFASWDRFQLPLPFSRSVIAVGNPIQVPPDATAELIEQKRREIEHELMGLRHRARDLACAHFTRADRPLGFAASRAR
ncbi:MAG: lysophospholipid acyltransferase family protein [Planctomycetota bacterium]